MSVSRRKFLKLGLNSAFIIAAGNVLKPFDGNFFDFPQGKLQSRFAIASDGHYGQPATPFESRHDQMVQWLNAEKAGKGIDFAFINGDLFHNEISFLPTVKNKWDQLTTPYYVSHGNHDQTDEEHWKAVWNMPWHFSFEQKDTGIIVLNTADEKGNYICPDADWTKGALQKYAAKEHLFVFMHITPFKWTKGGIDCPEIVDLFNQQKNLKAVFHGHDHDQDDVKEHNGKYYFFDSHIAGDWGTAYNGYRIVEVYGNGKILTYQMNPVGAMKVNHKNI